MNECTEQLIEHEWKVITYVGHALVELLFEYDENQKVYQMDFKNVNGAFLDYDLLQEKASKIVENYYTEESCEKYVENPFPNVF